MNAPTRSRAFARITAWNQTQLATLRRAGARLRDWLRGLREAQSDWRRAKREVDRRFDAELGVDTGGITAVRFLDVPEHRRDSAVDHIAIDPTEFTRAIAALPVELDAFTFVDFGAGKGRAVLLAAQQRFRRVVGVELAPELHQISKRNVQASLTEPRRADVELHCMDACDYELPDEPLVLYLYHPFGPDVLAPLVRGVVASYQRAPRPIFVVYLNPFHQQLWTDAGFLVCAADANYSILAAERGANQARPSASAAPEEERLQP